MLDQFLFVAFIVLFFLLRYLYQRNRRHLAYSNACPPPQIEEKDLVFAGSETGVSEGQIDTILRERCPYYCRLASKEQKRFLKRVNKFMQRKTFIIKSGEGFKDMPVLVSAAAVQLCFGLKDYLLPFYKYIRIYPEEYVSDHSFAMLAGNVQNNVISIAWNQLLKGNSDINNGSNVGLHEMGHALYIQKMVIEKDYAKKFSGQYDSVLEECRSAYDLETKGIKDLYSSYADVSLQEFWAETVELFFEKPDALLAQYPEVFKAASLLLNQDPRNRQMPVIKTPVSLNGMLGNMGSQIFPSRFFKRA